VRDDEHLEERRREGGEEEGWRRGGGMEERRGLRTPSLLPATLAARHHRRAVDASRDVGARHDVVRELDP